MNFLTKIIHFFKAKCKSKNPPRLQLKDVKAGDSIRINWHKVEGRIAYVKVLNNDPKIKKIFLEIKWGNYKQLKIKELEQFILNYNAIELAEFHLLNQVHPPKAIDEETDIYLLQQKLDQALKKEEYELARKIQDKINLLKKSN